MADHRRRWGRRRRRAEMVPLDATDPSAPPAEAGREPADPADILTERASLRHVLEVLEHVLTPRQFRVFVLHVVHQYKLVDVARIIGSTPNAVTVQYHRALRRVASHLGRSGNDDTRRG